MLLMDNFPNRFQDKYIENKQQQETESTASTYMLVDLINLIHRFILNLHFIGHAISPIKFVCLSTNPRGISDS